MNILVTHVYSKNNRGDAAIVATMLRRFYATYAGVSIALATMDSYGDAELFENATLVPSFFYSAIYTTHSAVTRVLNTCLLMLSTLVWALVYRVSGKSMLWLAPKTSHETLASYKVADIVVTAGGGWLLGKNTLHDTLTVLLQLHAIVMARLLGKPVVMFSGSIGPFGNIVQRLAVRLVLNRVQIIMARESLTLENLHSLGVHGPRVVETADAAFLFEQGTQEELSILRESLTSLGSGRLVGITVRNWLGGSKQKDYEAAMAHFAEWLVGRGYRVLFVPQVSSALHNDNDAEVQERIRKILSKEYSQIQFLPTTLSFQDVKNIFSVCDFVVGTRMHSVIFALTAQVPALAIAYERKTLGIMAQLGLDKHVVWMEHVTSEKLMEMFVDLEKDEAQYKAALRISLPKLQQKAELGFSLLSELIAKNKLK